MSEAAAGVNLLEYPKTRKSEQVDDYHGTSVADPYRWLEDDNASETLAWVKAQNQVTFNYLESIPFRSRLKQRLQELYNYPKYGIPSRSGPYYLWSKNDGLQNQSVLYIQEGLDGTPRVLLDPNQLSPDGTVRLMAAEASQDGRYFAYYLSAGGSDWLDGHVLEMATGTVLEDNLKWLKVTALAWYRDGFFYSRYDAPEDGRDLSARNEGHKVYYHRLGKPQSDDQLVYADPAHPQRFHIVQTTEDERFAILTVSERGQGKDGNALFFRDLSAPAEGFTPIVGEVGGDRYHVVDNIGDSFLIMTNHGAPNGRVMLYDPQSGWKQVVAETSDTLSSVSTQGGKLFLTYTRMSPPIPTSTPSKERSRAPLLCRGPGPRAALAEDTMIAMHFMPTRRSTTRARSFVTT